VPGAAASEQRAAMTVRANNAARLANIVDVHSTCTSSRHRYIDPVSDRDVVDAANIAIAID
jgi:hypothetical protein